ITMTIVASIISLVIVLSVAYFKIFLPSFAIPEVFTNWGGLIIGFYFGSFIGLVKDLLKKSPTEEGDRGV
ncbi:unnamed protein product, partial [marine sediment metagenome]